MPKLLTQELHFVQQRARTQDARPVLSTSYTTALLITFHKILKTRYFPLSLLLNYITRGSNLFDADLCQHHIKAAGKMKEQGIFSSL